ncbi:aspartate/glutamate racemase family protein [Candidatus Kaiserbacteria bacterium]|nr:aspartate/glutamate racemase family protein [Candidatus Kaiserbacteria bacterium]
MIGIFDSGSGGLTVLEALRKRSPEADVVYFGDIGNAPYGSKSQEELIQLVTAGIKALHGLGAAEIITACNSAAPSMLLGAVPDARFIDMTRPAARAMRKHAGKRVLLMATPATVASKMYTDALAVIVELDELPISGLARAIEFDVPAEETRDIVRAALKERAGETYDAIFLGCTHYPLVKDIIEEEARALFGNILLIDPAEAVADEALERFETVGTGKLVFNISKDSEHFRKRAATLFGNANYTITIT